jgi:phosphate transport system protein
LTQHLKREIEALRTRISSLGRRVSQQLDEALDALLSRDRQLALKVMNQDEAVDTEEVAIEEECLKIIALHQPVTTDLRFLATVLKVNSDLERIGDHAVNLALIAKKFSEKKSGDFPPQIIRMGRLVTQTCHRGIEAFVNADIDEALDIVHDDKDINELCGLIYDEAKQQLVEGRGTFGHAIRVYRIGRELERVGDLLKNIAEDTIYLVTGEVVRHNVVRLLDIESSRTE